MKIARQRLPAVAALLALMALVFGRRFSTMLPAMWWTASAVRVAAHECARDARLSFGKWRDGE